MSRRLFLDVVIAILFVLWISVSLFLGGRWLLISNQLKEDESHLNRLIHVGLVEKKVVQSFEYLVQNACKDLKYVAQLLREVVDKEWTILEFKEELAKHQLLYDHSLGFSFMKGRLPTFEELPRVSHDLRFMMFFMKGLQKKQCQLGQVQFFPSRVLFCSQSLTVCSYPLFVSVKGSYVQVISFLKQLIQKRTIFVECMSVIMEGQKFCLGLYLSTREYVVQ